MQNILFRADSSSSIGTGHIMRDLVLAKQFKQANIIFATQNLAGNINQKILDQGYSLKTLASHNINELISLIEKHHIDIIVIDHYQIDNHYEKELKEATKVQIFVLDDTYEEHHCDILLNHNIYAEAFKYKGLVPSHCKLQCGKAFTLLRDEFILQGIQTSVTLNKIPKLFIAMGGADHSHVTIDILKALENTFTFPVNIVTTTANQYLDELKEYVKDKDIYTLHINTNKVAQLMKESSIAIVSPSVILNEIFHLNIPFIAIQTAQNQVEMYNYLIKHEYPVLQKFDAVRLNVLLKGLLNG